MATELPKKPSDDDFANARLYVSQMLHASSIREQVRARAVLRYLLAIHDAKSAPVAVPREVAEWAERIGERVDADTARLHVAPWIRRVVAGRPAVAVPEDALKWAKAIKDSGLLGQPLRTAAAADWILSLVPEPEPLAVWKRSKSAFGNTMWSLMTAGGRAAYILRNLHDDVPCWAVECNGHAPEDFPDHDLAAAMRRAEDLCGVRAKGE